MVKKWTVSDYQTQGLKAEVILDMLLSEFIEEMAAAELGENLDAVKLLAKEFPIRTGDKSLRNAKVDYLVQAGNKIYLTELKTSNESLKDKQETNMKNAINKKAGDLWDFFRQIVKNQRRNSVAGRKYAHTLTHLKEKFNRSKAGFIPESLQKAELDILYICLRETPQSVKFFRNGRNHFYLKNLSDNGKFTSFLEKREKKSAWDKLNEILNAILNAIVKFDSGMPKLIKTKTFTENNTEYRKFYQNAAKSPLLQLWG